MTLIEAKAYLGAQYVLHRDYRPESHPQHSPYEPVNVQLTFAHVRHELAKGGGAVSEKWGAGDPAKWSDHGEITMHGKQYPLIYGEHPHSVSANHHYALMDGKPVEFDGHRILIGVELLPENYVKESELSGNEIRCGGTGRIFADGEQVFEFFFRSTEWALLKAHHLIGQLREHSSGWMLKKERDKLVGRPIYYREKAAVVQRLIVDQGCLIVTSSIGIPFPPPVYSERNDEHETSVKVEVTDPNIWWFRNRE